MCEKTNSENCDLLDKTCNSCFKIFKEYFNLIYLEKYYEKEINNLGLENNPNNTQIIENMKELKENIEKKKPLYFSVLKNKGIIDENNKIIKINTQLCSSEECSELKKLLQSHNLNTCTTSFTDSKILKNCVVDSSEADIYENEFTCAWKDNIVDNSVTFSLPYDITNSNLNIFQQRDKMVNIIKNFPSHECNNDILNNGRL